jgi:hypothetical protein
MADLRNFTDWDPSIERVEQLAGEGGGPDAEFEVVVSAGVGSTTLRYRTSVHEPPGVVLLEARTRALTSIDRITIVAEGDGCRVTYDAQLVLNGARRLLDPGLRLLFRRIGDRAAAGLERALDGARAG